MKILADENIEREFVEALRETDFDVLSVLLTTKFDKLPSSKKQ
jgi:GTP-binding protein EngB required for normal cell division